MLLHEIPRLGFRIRPHFKNWKPMMHHNTGKRALSKVHLLHPQPWQSIFPRLWAFAYLPQEIRNQHYQVQWKWLQETFTKATDTWPTLLFSRSAASTLASSYAYPQTAQPNPGAGLLHQANVTRCRSRGRAHCDLPYATGEP
eukprot:g25288.t1